MNIQSDNHPDGFETGEIGVPLGPSEPGSAGDDRDESGCPPPDEPIMVFCLHCGREYMSSEMVPPSGKRTAIMMEGMWWCGTPGCNAGGFGLDVFPVDPEWKDPKGLVHIITDSDDADEEFEWEEEEEEQEEP